MGHGIIPAMSHDISFTTADKAHILAFLGSKGDLTADQQRSLSHIRQAARAEQESLDAQGVDWGLSIPDALEHLLVGRRDSPAEWAGNAYTTALQLIIARMGSDPGDWGHFSNPAKFFGIVDDAMRVLGVPADLLPGGYLHGGAPLEFPHFFSVEGYPAIGHLPLAKAKPAADAYRAVLDRLDPQLRHDVEQIIKKLDFEHETWESMQDVDRYTQDTIFFWLT